MQRRHTVAFAHPANFTFGNSPRSVLRGRSSHNVDFNVAKNFAMTERLKTELRGEFFNAANRPQFGNPILDREAGPAFGLITSTVANPRLIQLALKYEF